MKKTTQKSTLVLTTFLMLLCFGGLQQAISQTAPNGTTADGSDLSSILHAWYDATNIANVHSDVPGSTDVTADGDRVMNLIDLSGNSPDLTISVSSQRPQYKEGAANPSFF